MIRYALKCVNGHGFESWFESADAFDNLSRRGLVACVECGSPEVTKAVMAPRIGHTSSPETDAPPRQPDPERHQLAARALARLRARVEAESDYVGDAFAREARDIHEGLAPARMIHGEASAKEARALVEEGVPILPLPFVPKGKLN